MSTVFHPPPPFFPLLAVWLLFPLHAPLTLLVLDAPFGRFAWKSRLNLPGNLAWAVMEIVAPITFLLNLDAGALSPRARTLAGLYVAHYAHRAVFSPLVLAPKRAPLHVMVVLSAIIFNVFNATLLARSLAAYPPSSGWVYYLGVGLWAVGFAGNVYHDEILHDLRRPPGEQLVSIPSGQKEDKSPDGRYTIPHGGLFRLVSFPNYFCEWLEWVGFAIAAAPTFLIPVPDNAFGVVSVLGHSVDLSAVAAIVPPRLLAPPWAFVLAEITSMLPRAVRGHAWYKDTFKHYPSERAAVIPGVV